MKLLDLHSTPFNFQAGAVLSIASEAALAAFDDRQYENGGVVYVETYRDYFQKIVESPAPAAAPNTIVPTATGDGGWYRLGIASPTWSAQKTWYIDPAAGSDENTGEVGVPLETWAEFTRRVVSLTGATSVYILSDMTTEGIVGTFKQGAYEASLYIAGVPTILDAGGVGTAFTSPSNTGNTRGFFTCTEIPDFSAYVGKMARVTNTAILPPLANEYVTPILRTTAGLGPNSVAQTGGWARASTSGSTPGAGLPVEILELPTTTTVQIETGGAAIQVAYLHITAPGSASNANNVSYATRGVWPFAQVPLGSNKTANFFACMFDGAISAPAQMSLVGCLFTAGTTSTILGSYSTVLISGGSLRDILLTTGGNVLFQAFIIQGGNLTLSYPGFVGNNQKVSVELSSTGLGVFDAPLLSGVVALGPVTISGRGLFGSGNGAGGAGYGLSVSGGARVIFDSGQTPTITGVTGDILFNAATTALPPPDQTTGVWAGTASFAGAGGVGWTAWAAAPFNRRIVSTTNGTMLTSA